MTRRWLAWLLAVGLAAAACSADGEDAQAPAEEAAASGSGDGSDDEEPELTAEERQLRRIRDHLDAPLRGDASREVAEALHDGRLLLRDQGIVDTSGGVPWEGWAADTSTAELRLLHSLLFVHDLVDVGGDADLRLADELVRDWVERNPRDAPAHAMAWHDETTGRRTTALIRLHDAHVEHGTDPDGAWRDELEGLIAAHLELLLDDEFHATGTNHGMFQDRAALLAAAYLEVRGAASDLTGRGWTIARDRLVEYYRSRVSEDGVHLEHAPAYHQLIATSARHDARLLGAFGDGSAADELVATHERMVAYATHVVQPDGTWPLVSDTFARGGPRRDLWEDPGYRFAASGGEEGAPPSETAAVFEDAGYVISRDRWTDDGRATYVHFTAAYHGDYHKHADDLSVWLYHDGPLLTELGPQGYTMSDPLVQCAYSDLAHNIATVEGLELPRTDERVGWTRLTDVDVRGPVRTAAGSNERVDGVTFERRISHDVEAGVLEVVDRVRTGTDRSVQLRWHLDPSVTATVDGTQVALAREGLATVTGSFRSDADLEVEVLGPDEAACSGLRFGGPEPEDTSTVVIRTEPRQVTEVVSRFDLP